MVRYLLVGLGLSLWPGWSLGQSVPLFEPVDFVEYWSAARVHLLGGNPYDGEQILPYQQQCSGDPEKTSPTMLWTPPWTLPLYWPSGLLAPREAHLLWIGLQVLCCFVSVLMIWSTYNGPTHRYWLLVPVCFLGCSAPLIWLWLYGQNTGFLLLGLAGFAFCRQRNWPYLAGVFAALTAVKPHFLALFGWALLLDAYRSDGRKSLAAGVGMLLLGAGLALWPNPEIFTQFVQAITSPSQGKVVGVSDWQLPLLSYQLRITLEPLIGKVMGVGFLPLFLGVLALTVYWWKRRQTWDWLATLPGLIFGSALLAPYGGWLFDLVVLLFPMVALLATVHRQPVYLLLVGILCGPLLFLVASRTMEGLEQGWWITPALMAIYWLIWSTRAMPPLPPDG